MEAREATRPPGDREGGGPMAIHLTDMLKDAPASRGSSGLWDRTADKLDRVDKRRVPQPAEKPLKTHNWNQFDMKRENAGLHTPPRLACTTGRRIKRYGEVEQAEVSPSFRPLDRQQKGDSHFRSFCAAGGSAYAWFCVGLGYESVNIQRAEEFYAVQGGNDSFASAALELSGSLLCFGAILGAIATAPICDGFGRRVPLLVGSMQICAGGVWWALASQAKQWELCCTWFLIGSGCGTLTASAPVYISEISRPAHRGKMLILLTLNLCLGILTVNSMSYISALPTINSHIQTTSSHKPRSLFGGRVEASGLIVRNKFEWRFVGWVLAGFALLEIIFAVILPESPKWLLANSKTRKKTADTLDHFNDPAEHSVAAAHEDNELSRSNLCIPCCQQGSYNAASMFALLVGLVLTVFQQLALALLCCAKIPCDRLLPAPLARTHILYAIVQIAALLPLCFFVDKPGRRAPAAVGTLCALFVFSLGGSLGFFPAVPAFVEHSNSSDGSETAFLMCAVALAGGLAPLPFVVIPEMLQFSVRSLGCASCAALSWLLIAVFRSGKLSSVFGFPRREMLEEIVTTFASVQLPNEEIIHSFLGLMLISMAGAKFILAFMGGPFDTAALTLEASEAAIKSQWCDPTRDKHFPVDTELDEGKLANQRRSLVQRIGEFGRFATPHDKEFHAKSEYGSTERLNPKHRSDARRRDR